MSVVTTDRDEEHPIRDFKNPHRSFKVNGFIMPRHYSFCYNKSYIFCGQKLRRKILTLCAEVAISREDPPQQGHEVRPTDYFLLHTVVHKYTQDEQMHPATTLWLTASSTSSSSGMNSENSIGTKRNVVVVASNSICGGCKRARCTKSLKSSSPWSYSRDWSLVITMENNEYRQREWNRVG